MNEITRMRDAGRSWTEIADRLGITVSEAKAAVRDDKRARREGLARTPQAEDRNGLRDLCTEYGYYDEQLRCTHPRKDHEDFSGRCLAEGCKCEEFVHKNRSLLPWWRLPKKEDPHYIDPDIQLSARVSVQAYQLGVSRKTKKQWTRGSGSVRPDVQEPRLETLARRARKKLKQGKKLKRHYNAPKGNERV